VLALTVLKVATSLDVLAAAAVVAAAEEHAPRARILDGASSESRVASALETLQSLWYNSTTGSWVGGKVDPDRGTVDSGMIGWWNAANTLEVIAFALQRLPADSTAWAPGQRESLAKEVIPKMYKLQNWTGCMQSRSYDDSGWVSLAWIRAYEVSGTKSYLERAMAFFEQVASEAWDDVCGGGLYWAGDKAGGGNRYKNAISNELFLTTAMRLYAHAPNTSVAASYLGWAQREWEWFRSSGMIVNGSYVAGGLHNCSCDMAEGYTYNQGVILSGLGLLYAATPEHEPESRAELIAAAEGIAMGVVESGSRWLSKNGVLVEPCEESVCNADGTQFKGIFVRYLREYLDSVCPNSRPKSDAVGDSNLQHCASPNADLFRQFLRANARSVWASARSETNMISVHWRGPPPQPDATNGAIAQTSGTDALLSVAGW
jgi:predicted alpha-1,6-mannanase (GH76 family)